MKFAAFYMAEYMKMIAVSAIASTMFFGGYRFFGLENLLGGWLGTVMALTLLFVAPALPITGAVGSPINPLAIK